jgi:hypothetical protein
MNSTSPYAERRRAWPIAVALALALAFSVRASARERVVFQGLVDAEAWDTDSQSVLLQRNEDRPSTLGRLRLWAAADMFRGLEGFALGEVEGGNANDDGETEVELEQAFLRYFPPGPAHLRLEAGKLTVPFGNFSRRYFSTSNPLIGAPDSYGVSYPRGAALTGKVGKVDWMVAALDRPLANEKYLPESDPALRPAASIGFTPMIGVRLAAYWTQGPYLGRGAAPMISGGASWRDFDQQIAGFDLAFSRGYFELNGDLAFSSYDVPTTVRPSRGVAWFLEPKYTWTPRWFTALRLEHNDYPLIMPISSFFWVADNAEFYDLEVGAGYRLTPDLVLKAAYRADRWNVSAADEAEFPDGSSFSIQVSYAFDVNSWFHRPQ